LQELALVLTTENFTAWLASTRVLAQDGGLLRVAVSSQFHKDWLEAKL
jgi:chromosomal replication initiation ATPase DnaA